MITGPLVGVKVVEIAGVGPGPFAAMMMADMGADVLCLDRAIPVGQSVEDPRLDPIRRGRRSVAVNLKHASSAEMVLRLVERADALIEGFRPGVTERLGIGPDVCMARNPRLVYGRVTGWGQRGPMAQIAGHDINYIAVAGALHPIGRRGGPPTLPLNYLGDYAGGGMLLAYGIACALLEARSSGRGQVVDAAMLDGAALLTAVIHGLMAMGLWSEERGTNVLDGGAPFYEVYATSDDRFVAVGAEEDKFYAELLHGLKLDVKDLPDRTDHNAWPILKQRFAEVFAAHSQRHWMEVFNGTDACVSPVLSAAEAPGYGYNQDRDVFFELGGVVQPSPAPRFSRTPSGRPSEPAVPGQHTREALLDWGFSAQEIQALVADAAVRIA